jgi:hypothetical protein
MNKIKIFLILLLISGFSSSFAQATVPKANEKSEISEKALMDSKLSEEERALLLTAGEDNPAKIDEASMVDPKMDPKEVATEDDFGDSNAKPKEGHDLDQRLLDEISQEKSQEKPTSTVQPATVNNQPVGVKNGTVVNYRNVSGPVDQPRGNDPVSTTNYRDIKGSADQPAGDPPTK